MRPGHSTLALLLLAGGPLLAAAEPRPRLDIYGDPLPPGAVARLGTVRFRTPGGVALSPDGKTAASLEYRGYTITVYLWEIASGRILERFRLRHKGCGGVLAFAPDGLLLVTMSEDNDVLWLWDVAAGKLVRKFRTANEDSFSVVCFSPDHKRMAAAGSEGVYVWELASGKLFYRCRSGQDVVVFSPDGKTLASAGWNKEVCFWDAGTGRELRHWPGHAETIDTLAFSPDGKTLASGDQGGVVWLWEAATGKPIRHDRCNAEGGLPMAFSPDGKVLAVGNNTVIDLYETVSGKKVASCRGHLRGVGSLRFAPDGRWLLSASGDGAVRLWDPATGKPLPSKPGHVEDVTAVAFSPDGCTVASGGADGTLRLWDVRTGRQLDVRADHGRIVTLICFAPDGKRLASTASTEDKGGEVRAWEVTPERRLRPAWMHAGNAVQAVFSPDGKTVAAAAADKEGTHFLWDAGSGKELRRWRGHPGWSEGLWFSPNGAILVSVDSDGGMQRWETNTGRPLRMSRAEAGATSGEASCPDGRTWACVQGSLIDVWDGATGKRRWSLWGEYAFALSADGGVLAAPIMEGRLRLYDVATGRAFMSWEGHGAHVVRAVAFSPDGKLLATASEDSTVLIWDIDLVLHGDRPLPATLSEEDVAFLWQELASDDVRQVHRAIGRLAAAPGQAVPFLGQRLQPLQIEGPCLERLLAELDNDDFAVREKATRRLAAFGAMVEPGLRQTLASGPSAEVRRRVKQLLACVERRPPTTEQLRPLRCLAVLERASTAEARRVLHTLAEGTEGARLTQAARAALRRLDGPARGRSETKAD